MRAETASGQDWRDSAAYAPLLDADPSLFAWEWLRRDTAYRAAARRALSWYPPAATDALAPEAFGLVAFEPSHLGAPHARPLWRSNIHPYVLQTEAVPTTLPGEAFDVDRMQGIARVIMADDADHLLLSDGLRAVRLDGPRGTFSSGPACLRYRIEGLAAAEPPLLTLQRFVALCRTGRFSRLLHARQPRARRWILTLRTWDALTAGADQRQIAQALLSTSASEARWRIREPSVRSQVQRLVRSARRLAGGGYREFLRH